MRKDEPNGATTARVFFDGTRGLNVNTRTTIRDQERSPISADLKSALREKEKTEDVTFVFMVDVSAAHQQIPAHPSD